MSQPDPTDHVARPATRFVEGLINYTRRTTGRLRYHAYDGTRDTGSLDGHTVGIEDARSQPRAPCLEREGFVLLPHKSAVIDSDTMPDAARYMDSRCSLEIMELMRGFSSADVLVFTNPPCVRVNRSREHSGVLHDDYPINVAHVDISRKTAIDGAASLCPKGELRRVRRFAYYNIWRAISPPPQDTPLAVCDASTVSEADLTPTDAVYDYPGQAVYSHEALSVHYSPRHRWCYFSNMTRDEVLIFQMYDSAPGRPGPVPHCAFLDPSSPADAPQRCSIEMRLLAYWYH